jgi:uncharacterized protein (TIGR00251 family)
LLLRVKVRPGASRNQSEGCIEGVWAIRLTAPPVEGKANAALVEFLSSRLGIPKRDIEIVRGARGRLKTLSVVGLTEAEVEARLTP